MSAASTRAGLGVVVAGLGVLALLAPLGVVDVAPRVGALLSLAGLLQIGHAFRRADDAAQRAAWLSGAATLAMGLLLVSAPFLAATALLVLLAAGFALDGVRRLGAAALGSAGGTRVAHLLAATGNLAVAALLIALRGGALDWTVAVAGALRLAGTAWDLLTAPVHAAGDAGGTVVRDLGLDDPELVALADRLAAEEQARAAIDRGWILAFLATLFAIHVGRMGFDRSALGILSPGVAVLGDVLIGLVLAFAVVVPADLALRRLLRPFERRAWRWCLRVPPAARRWPRQATAALLTARLRFAVRLRTARYSLRAALGRGLQIGLPLAAVLAATFPVWGMSWYFDTENWAAGVWNSWAESRTDTWRETMLRAVSPAFADPAAAPPPCAVAPPGLDGDFAFVVIGDTGEGDASQHVLRDQLLAVAAQPETRFVVVSSDVVYPTGAMKDYEAKFWLPFKGVRVPVYAIPGNHDWYDALEGFSATFLTADAARAAMRARVAADLHLSSSTDAHIDDLVARAAALRAAYGVPTGWQQAPFFQLQTPRFALLAVDTGVARRIDPLQQAWLEAALDASRGKFILAILGHPFYAGGGLQGADRDDFRALHELLRARGVAVVMAGDTHDFEYYAEPLADRTLHHFVNGGGGAYLSFGTALAWPAIPPAPAWAFYPTSADVVAKIEQLTPPWKRPAWWWTHRFGAWPLSAEFLSAAFDYNQAPFFQSFVQVRVEPSAGRVRILPYGIDGRLRWNQLQTSPALRPAGVAPEAPAEWVLPLAE